MVEPSDCIRYSLGVSTTPLVVFAALMFPSESSTNEYVFPSVPVNDVEVILPFSIALVKYKV